MQKLIVCGLLACGATWARVATAQSGAELPARAATAPGNAVSTPLPGQATLSPGAIELLTLEGQFAQAVEKGGGAAFSKWFAEDAITLNNGRAAVYGQSHIAANASWKPEEYRLTWYPEYAQMGASGDMGYTWGHYEGTSKDRKGNPVTTSGRYMTIWKKASDGKWKVALDASADEPGAASHCGKLPTP